jgi:hypothetical protein
MADEVKPDTPVVQTTTVSTATGPPVPAPDDNARKWLGTIIVIQWAFVMGFSVVMGKPLDSAVLQAENMVLMLVVGYFYGSSSGSTLKQSQGK